MLVLLHRPLGVPHQAGGEGGTQGRSQKPSVCLCVCVGVQSYATVYERESSLSPCVFYLFVCATIYVYGVYVWGGVHTCVYVVSPLNYTIYHAV